MIVQISPELMAAVGATTATEFPDKLSAFIAESTKAKSSMLTLEALATRIEALEKKPTAEAVAGITEARVTEIVTAALANDTTKATIKAEASKVFLDAGAATGTHPVKPSPANPTPTANATADLIKAGKYEEAYAGDKALQAEFTDAKNFAAYAKANAAGQIRISNK